jgi:hypothetical protein
MTCEESKGRMAAYWSESLDEAEELALEAHLVSCGTCRRETEHLGTLWQDLGRLPAPEPSEALRPRFYESLAAFQHGMESGSGWTSRWARFWPSRPLAQMAAAAALLAVGWGTGYALRSGQPEEDIASLKQEVASMRQMVALSLLQQQSASERLRGVSWAYRAEPTDTEVMEALIFTLQHDQMVNVRLAAARALGAFAGNPRARRAVVESLARETAPLVQVELINLLVDLKDRDAVADLRNLAAADVNEIVKERAQWALGELQ